MLDFLDPAGTLIGHRLYRQHCTEIQGGHFKDMRRMGRSLDDIVLVDNSPLAMGLTPDNGVLITSWYGFEYQDQELVHLQNLLHTLSDTATTTSIPEFLRDRYGLGDFLRRQHIATMNEAQVAQLLPQFTACVGS